MNRAQRRAKAARDRRARLRRDNGRVDVGFNTTVAVCTVKGCDWRALKVGLGHEFAARRALVGHVERVHTEVAEARAQVAA